jgi:hypothetical protein
VPRMTRRATAADAPTRHWLGTKMPMVRRSGNHHRDLHAAETQLRHS